MLHPRSTQTGDGFCTKNCLLETKKTCAPPAKHTTWGWILHQELLTRTTKDLCSKNGAHDPHMKDSTPNCSVEPQKICAPPAEHTKTRWILYEEWLTRTAKYLCSTRGAHKDTVNFAQRIAYQNHKRLVIHPRSTRGHGECCTKNRLP